MNAAVVQWVIRKCELVMGRIITRDVFADPNNTHLSITGIIDINWQTDFLWINGDYNNYSHLVQHLVDCESLVALVAPKWEMYVWFHTILAYCTHVFVPKPEINTFTPASTNYKRGVGPDKWSTAVYLCDFRFPRARGRDIVRILVPNINKCTKVIAELIPHVILPPLSPDLEPNQTDRPHTQLNADQIMKLGTGIGITENLLSNVVNGLNIISVVYIVGVLNFYGITAKKKAKT